MEEYNVHIVNINKDIKVGEHTDFIELSKRFADCVSGNIVAARVNNSIVPLYRTVNDDCDVEFIDITHPEGFRIIKRTCSYIMFAAIYELYGTKAVAWVQHSLNNNYYCKLENIEPTDEVLAEIKAKMQEIINSDYRIEHISCELEDAIEIFRKYNLDHRVRSLKYIKSNRVTLYKLNNYYDYMYGIMAPSSGYIRSFNIVKANEGFLLCMENPKKIGEINTPSLYPKMAQIFSEFKKQAWIMGIKSVAELNECICRDKISDLILLCEALHEKKVAAIADEIYMSNKRIVLIAGPSSSGKTTFSRRLGIQLRVLGLKPHIITLDNYYKPREEIATDETGKKNFEDIEALDIEGFNNDLLDILAGKEVATPVYDFALGRSGNQFINIKLEKDEVLVIEGIHGINEKLTAKIPASDKYKIYISAITQINIDEHNRISTTDTRLIRRMVRDHYFRGFNAKDTIDMWQDVLAGERKNIFPYQEQADVMFNSALIYELGVLKPFVEPILLDIDKTAPAYIEAQRILNFLNSFLTINDNDIPANSLIREFIGDCIFYRNKGSQH